MSRENGIPDADRAGDAPLPRQTHAFFGHAEAEAELLEGYRGNRLAHAWILGGPEGIGKATLAWRFARFLLCHPNPAAPAVQEARSLQVDPANAVARRVASGAHGNVFRLRREYNEKTKKLRTEISAESVRDAISHFQLSATEGGWRICILDSAEDLNRHSANALLKLIEEPPTQSVFLIVSQKPGQILPTIRSRCRKLLLQALPEADIASAIGALPPASGQFGAAAIIQAAARAEGSVREALRLLDPETLAFDRKLHAALNRLPAIDWREVHALADAVSRKEGEDLHDTLIRSVFAYVDHQVRAGGREGKPTARLLALAELWEKLRDNIREADALNLDKKAVVLGIFADMAAATGRA